MSELTVDLLVANILNSMSQNLDDEQLQQLKDQLYIQLHDVDLIPKRYDIVAQLKDSDIEKLKYFATSLKIANRSEGTIKRYLEAARKLRIFIGKDFADITSVDIKYFIAIEQQNHTWKDTTIQNNIQYLRAFYSFLKREEMIEKNPMDKIVPVKLEQTIKKAFNSGEMELLRLACRSKTREAALIEFLYATGIRVSELIKLKWNDLDMQHLNFYVLGKGNKEREVPFSEKAGFYLLRYMDERMTKEHRTKEEMMQRPVFVNAKRSPETGDFEALSIGGIRHILHEIGDEAGVEEIYPHKFRRTFATDAINHGMQLEHLSVLMGHSKYDTTMIYAHIKSTTIEQAYRECCE
jgi:site-specific recombinase XerD